MLTHALDSPGPSTSGFRSRIGTTLTFDLVVTTEKRSPSHTTASRNALTPGMRNKYRQRTDLPALSLLTFSVMYPS